MRTRPLATRPHGVRWRTPTLLVVLVSAVVGFAAFGTGVSTSQAIPLETPATGALSGDEGAIPATLAAASDGSDDGTGSPSAEDRAHDEGRATEVFGTVEGLELRSPSHEAKVHGFHQAGDPDALALTPVGENTTVLPSRGRGTAATSAVDIVLVDDDPVVSPVSGTVTDHATYKLYGDSSDRRLVIRPDEAPHLRVVILHIGGMQVEPGDDVVAGETVLAGRARKLPFDSQVDRETAPDAWPHVHLEVKDRS